MALNKFVGYDSNDKPVYLPVSDDYPLLGVKSGKE